MLLDTPICEFGWPAPAFSLCDPDGLRVSLEDLSNNKGFLICFLCNHCPYVRAVIDRLAVDARALQGEGLKVVAIMSNDYQSVPADSPDRMREFSRRHNLSFPYLVDEDQSVAKAFGAVCTPEFFGFNGQNELQYRGRLDDAAMGDAANRIRELVNAMRQIAETGRGPKQQTPSMGCSMKWR